MANERGMTYPSPSRANPATEKWSSNARASSSLRRCIATKDVAST